VATIAAVRIPFEIKRRIERAVQWLLLRQERSKGYWGEESPWLTGIVIWALALSTRQLDNLELRMAAGDAIEAAIKWLQSCQNESGWDVEVGTWDTAIIVRGMIAAGKVSSPLCQSALDYLDKRGRDWFGKTKVPYGEGYPAQTLLALIEGGRDRSNYRWITETLKQEQDSQEGAWEDHLTSPEVIEAICIAEGKDALWKIYSAHGNYDGGLSKAVRWIEKSQSRYGHWGGYTWHTATTLRCYLIAAQHPDGKVIGKALSWLLNQQHPTDGSWFHSVELTAFAVQSLCSILEQGNELLEAITPPILGPEPAGNVARPSRILSWRTRWIILSATILLVSLFDVFWVQHVGGGITLGLQLIEAQGVVVAAILGFIGLVKRRE
jgi:hypothetical protein